MMRVHTSPLQIVLCALVVVVVLCATVVAKASKLEVFMVPHSHCDPGWLKTATDYYRQDVQHILTNVVNSLTGKPHRRFIWAEISFLQWWFEEQDSILQRRFTEMVQSGQIELVGGGWVQNDEGCSSYTSHIEQMSLGHQYILERFGVRPRIAWQIDPFGHGSMAPRLYADMGFDALVLNRVHHKIKTTMKREKSLEFIWKNDDAETTSAKQTPWTMFTHVLHTHYSAPEGFDFENPGVHQITDQTVAQRSAALVNLLKGRAEHFRTNHILVPFGDDFKFKNAEHQFSNMDKLIDYINAHSNDFGVNIRYSTLSEYFDALHAHSTSESQVHFPVLYNADFFPYADNEDSYWTGYYTTKPELKRSARTTEALASAAESAYTLAKSLSADGIRTSANSDIVWRKLLEDSVTARQEVSLVQHHDAITGTSKGHVLADYIRRLEVATRLAENVERQAVRFILTKKSPPTLAAGRPSKTSQYGNIVLFDSDDQKQYQFVVYNSESHSRLHTLCFQSRTPGVHVTKITSSEDVEEVPIQVSPRIVVKGQEAKQDGFEVCFPVKISGFAIDTYFIDESQGDYDTRKETTTFIYTKGGAPVSLTDDTIEPTTDHNDLIIENDIYRIHFEPNTGYMHSVETKLDGNIHPLSQQFLEYRTHRSGSYLFRSEGEAQPLADNTLLHVVVTKGPLVHQAKIFSKKLTVTITLQQPVKYGSERNNHLQEAIQIHHYIEPISGNTELVTRLFNVADKANSNNRPEFFTFDGLQFQRRYLHEIDKAPTMSARYVPAVAGSVLVDRATNTQFTVLNEWTVGCMVTPSGDKQSTSLEVMIHRRLENDDGRGMGEGNRDTTDAAITFYVNLHSRKADSPRVSNVHTIHTLSHSLNHPLNVFVSNEEDHETYKANHHTSFEPLADIDTGMQIISLLSTDVGDNVALRVHNTKEQPISLDAQNDLFKFPLKVEASSLRSLNLLHDEPAATLRHSYLEGSPIKFSYTDYVKELTGPGGSQNTNEKGVFISDAALELNKNKNTRTLKAFVDPEEDASDGNRVLTIQPLSIATLNINLRMSAAAASASQQQKNPVAQPAETRTPIITRTEPLPLPSQQQQQQQQQRQHYGQDLDEEQQQPQPQPQPQPQQRPTLPQQEPREEEEPWQKKPQHIPRPTTEPVAAPVRPMPMFSDGFYLFMFVMLVICATVLLLLYASLQKKKKKTVKRVKKTISSIAGAMLESSSRPSSSSSSSSISISIISNGGQQPLSSIVSGDDEMSAHPDDYSALKIV